MTELKEGFYWNKRFYGDYHLVYYGGHVPEDKGIIFADLFDERGNYGVISTEVDRLTLFDPERDMERLNSKTAERVKQKLEKLVGRD